VRGKLEKNQEVKNKPDLGTERILGTKAENHCSSKELKSNRKRIEIESNSLTRKECPQR
jgi:hypothetical protein